MLINAKYVHTNLIARDWKKLSQFYQEVFGFTPVPPERHFKSSEIEKGTGVKGSELHGIHLRMPGYGESGPTLEIFSYSIQKDNAAPEINRPGFGHIAFSVTDVSKAREIILQKGGRSIGEITTVFTSEGAKVTWCYVTDCENNILELQSWSE